MKNSLLLYKGAAFESQGSGRFAKDVVRVGDWIHPQTGQRVSFDQPRLRRLAENTQKYLAAGNKIPFPDGHSMKASDNLGFWPGPFIVHKDQLVGVVEPTDAAARKKIAEGSLDAVSVLISFEEKDSAGNHYDEVIQHVCATNYPVVTGQGAFIKLSMKDGREEIPFVEQEAGDSPQAKAAQEALDRLSDVLRSASRPAPVGLNAIAEAALQLAHHVPGQTFAECVSMLRGKPGVTDPEGLCAFLKRRAGEIK